MRYGEIQTKQIYNAYLYYKNSTHNDYLCNAFNLCFLKLKILLLQLFILKRH